MGYVNIHIRRRTFGACSFGSFSSLGLGLIVTVPNRELWYAPAIVVTCCVMAAIVGYTIKWGLRMKWLAVYFTIINSQTFYLDDIDGPQQFETYQKCAEHAVKAAAQMQVLMRDMLIREPDLLVRWKCDPL